MCRWTGVQYLTRAAAVNRILLHAHEVTQNGRAVLTGARAEHVRSVLHATAGQTLRVGVLDGPAGLGTVVELADAVVLQCVLDAVPPPVPRVDLLLALPRPKVLKRLWAQLAALGVHRILLTNAARVEREYFDTHWLTEPHRRPLLVEGLQQAGDTRVPVVTVARSFRRLVEDELDALCPATQRLVAHPGAGPRLLHAPVDGRRALLAVGPEGGWNGFELELLGAHGFAAVQLGGRILRADTACVALLALLHQRLDGYE